jgi:hypothetical protein
MTSDRREFTSPLVTDLQLAEAEHRLGGPRRWPRHEPHGLAPARLPVSRKIVQHLDDEGDGMGAACWAIGACVAALLVLLAVAIVRWDVVARALEIMR